MRTQHPLSKITLTFITWLFLSACTLTPRPSPLASLKVDPYAPIEPAYEESCLPPFFILPDSNYSSHLNNPESLDFDQNGVIKYNYESRADNAGWQYTPYIIASFGITGLNAWCQKHDPIGLQLALNQADYLLDHAVVRDGFVTWQYHFPTSMFEIPANFTSAFANAYVLVLFTQLHAITGEERFIDMARQIIPGYNVDTVHGGVRSIMDDGTYFYEEYAYPQAPEAHILNGHMAAVAGLRYYGLYANDPLALRLADQGIAAVQSHLEDFDTGVYSLYDLQRKMFVDYAHDLHIRYLFWMYRYTQEPIFLKYAFRWQNYNRGDNYNIYAHGNSFPNNNYLLYRLLVMAGYGAFLQGSYLFFNLEDPVYFDLDDVETIGGLNYYTEGSWPTDYIISTSSDAETWQDVVVAQDYNQRSANYCFNNLNAKYIRLIVHKLMDEQTTGQGRIRVTHPSFCEDVILLMTTGDLAEPNSLVLRDANSKTSLSLTRDTVIYGDLRDPKLPLAFILAGDTKAIKMQAWVEVSNDLSSWRPLIPPEEAIDVLIPGPIPLPEMSSAWQYFRLHLTHELETDVQMPIHTFSLKY